MTDKKNQAASSEDEETNSPGSLACTMDKHSGSSKGKDLGIAGRLAQGFIHSPLSPLFYFTLLGLGFMGMMFTPRQEDPQISVPMVDIFVSYPGASSKQVASMIASPLEEIMSEIQGIEHVYSASQRGSAMVTVQFIVGEDMGESLVKMYDKLESNRDKIPPGATPPLVKPKAVDDVPTVTLTLWSTEMNDADLRLLSLDVAQRLKAVKNTSQTFITGGRSEQIRIEVDPARLAGFDLTLDQLARTISSANGELSAGSIESGVSSFEVYTGSFLKTASDIENLVIGTQGGSVVYVRDVATVKEGPEETKSVVNFYTGPAYQGNASAVPDGAPAVTISIAKKAGSNGVDIANEVLAKVESLKGRLIPDNVNVAVTRNYGKTANDKVNSLILKLFFVTGAVTLLIWYFLGLRASIVVLIVIPNVIMMTVFMAWIMGFTIDRVSLFALIFSIGILVDDAIVVVENIYRRWLEEGNTSTEIAVDAVREVGNPTILATFTVIAALLPMGAVSGMMGPYMMPIPILGSVAMLFSLFAAFVFTPYLAMRLKPSLENLKKAEIREHKGNEKLERFFRKILTSLITNKRNGRLFLISLFVIFFASMSLFYFGLARVKVLPLDNKAEFNVVINMPDGTALPDTSNLSFKMTKALQTLPEVTQLQSYVGTASPFNFNGLVRHSYLRQRSWEADIQVELVDKGDRSKTSHDLAEEARALLTPIAEAAGGRIQVVEMPPGPPVLQTMVAEIYGPDAQTRRQFARDMEKMFQQAEYITDVDTLMPDEYYMWRFEIDREKAIRRGVSVETINRNLDMAMGGYKLGDIKVERILEPRFIVLQTPLSQRSQLNQMLQLPIASSRGNTVPLAELGEFIKVKHDPIIYKKDLQPVEFVTGEMTGALAAPVYGIFDIMRQMEDYVAPDGVKPEFSWYGTPTDTSKSTWEWTGEWTVTWETFRDMGGAFMIALVLIYILVVWEFGNFIMPAIIMSPIPLTLIGIVPGHALLGKEFTATSMIGFIALAGIIVRNSILLVEFSRDMVAKGYPVSESMILACKTRTRPIVITAMALVLGSLFILSDPIFNGMAITLMFGVIISTVLTLLVIPLGCMSARKAFCAGSILPDDPMLSGVSGNGEASQSENPEKKKFSFSGFAFKVWSILFTIVSTIFFAIRAIYLLIKNIFDQRKRRRQSAAQIAAVDAEKSRQATENRTTEKSHTAEAVRKPEEIDKAEKTETARKAGIKKKKQLAQKKAVKRSVKKAKKSARKAAKKAAKKAEKKAIKKQVKLSGIEKKITPKSRRGIRLKPPGR